MSQSVVPARSTTPQHLATTPMSAADAGQFLSFQLGDIDYALPILRVQEIRRRESMTRLPGNPPALRGVINLRGAVLPVLELGELLQTPKRDRNEAQVMIVVTLGDRLAGLLVDGVSDVVQLQANEIRPIPDMLPGNDRGVAGIATVDERMLLLLDIEQLLGIAPVAPLPQAA